MKWVVWYLVVSDVQLTVAIGLRVKGNWFDQFQRCYIYFLVKSCHAWFLNLFLESWQLLPSI